MPPEAERSPVVVIDTVLWPTGKLESDTQVDSADIVAPDSSIADSKQQLATVINDHLSSISFAGCGFLCIYHVGVAAALRMFVPEELRSRWTLYGASSGSLVSALLLCADTNSFGSAARLLLENSAQARSFFYQPFKALDFKSVLLDGLEEILPADAHTICSGRLHISLTRMRDLRNVIVSEFASRQELIDAIICSCYIPGLLGWMPPTFHGEYYVDGVFSNNQPVAVPSGDGEGPLTTITVSPFVGETDICPGPRDEASASPRHLNLNGTSIQLTATNVLRAPNVLFRQLVVSRTRPVDERKLSSSFCVLNLAMQQPILLIEKPPVRRELGGGVSVGV